MTQWPLVAAHYRAALGHVDFGGASLWDDGGEASSTKGMRAGRVRLSLAKFFRYLLLRLTLRSTIDGQQRIKAKL